MDPVTVDVLARIVNAIAVEIPATHAVGAGRPFVAGGAVRSLPRIGDRPQGDVRTAALASVHRTTAENDGPVPMLSVTLPPWRLRWRMPLDRHALEDDGSDHGFTGVLNRVRPRLVVKDEAIRYVQVRGAAVG